MSREHAQVTVAVSLKADSCSATPRPQVLGSGQSTGSCLASGDSRLPTRDS
jgi:hypothetical protein